MSNAEGAAHHLHAIGLRLAVSSHPPPLRRRLDLRAIHPPIWGNVA